MLSHCLNQMVWVTKEYDRTKRYYTRKAGKGVIAVLKDNTTRGKPLVPPTLFLRCGAPPDLQWWRLTKTGWTWRWWRHLPNVTRLPTLGRSVAKYFPSWQIRCALPNSFVIFLVWPTIDLRTPNAIALPHYGRGGPVKSLRVRPW